MKSVAKFRAYRPPQPLTFTDGRSLIYRYEESITTVRVLTTLAYGSTAWMTNNVLFHSSGTGWFNYLFQVSFCVAGFGLSVRTHFSSKMLVSRIDLMDNGKLVEITNSRLIPAKCTVPIMDISLEMDNPKIMKMKGKYIQIKTKSGQKFIIPALGYIPDKELLKSMMKGEEIDTNEMNGKRNSNIIDV